MQFQVPQNQQKPSDHDKLMTSNPNRHNFQTILKICTANFQITEKPKKRYIIRATCESRNRFQRKRQAEYGKQPYRNSFQKSATILIFYGRGFVNRHFTETHRLYAPCPDCPDLCPYFYLRKPSKATCDLQAGYRQVTGKLVIGSATSCQVENSKIDILFTETMEKSRICNIKCRFYNFTNLTNLTNLRNPISYLRNLSNHEQQEKSIASVGRQLGRSWEKVGEPHLWTFGTFPYAHVKIPKPEVKRPDA